MIHQLFDHKTYTLRILSTLIIAQVLVLACIKFWPLSSLENPVDVAYPDSDAIMMEEIVQTFQPRSTPQPVTPLPPIIKSDDIILDEEPILELDPLLISGPPAEELPMDSSSVSLGSSVPPKPIRIVTPEYPRHAQRRQIRAEIIIHVIVDKSGRVQSPQILERYLLDESIQGHTLVEELGYGLEEAAVNAALKSIFRPAKKGGITVDSYHKLSFKFGI